MKITIILIVGLLVGCSQQSSHSEIDKELERILIYRAAIQGATLGFQGESNPNVIMSTVYSNIMSSR